MDIRKELITEFRGIRKGFCAKGVKI